MSENYKFICHSQCEYFPCHQGINEEDFNCLFCYCPLYMLGEKCGGNFQYTSNGVKTCINCGIPHNRKNYNYIIDKFSDIVCEMKSSIDRSSNRGLENIIEEK